MRMLGWMKESLWLGGLVALLVVCVLLAFFELPNLVVSPDDLSAPLQTPTPRASTTSAPTAVDLVQARNGVRTAAVALIAGIGAALATGFAARTYYLSRRGQFADRYTSAIDALAKDPTAQVSAIGELERLAYESPTRHRQIMRDLANFVRGNERPAEPDPDTAPAPAAVQAAFAVLASRRRRYDRALVVDLAGADLRQIHFDRGAQLRGANLSGVKLAGAHLRHADLRNADLANAVAPSVRLDQARLQGTILKGAGLHHATLDRANARGAAFVDAQFDATSLRGTNLRGATGLPLHEDGVRGGLISRGRLRKTRLPKPTER